MLWYELHCAVYMCMLLNILTFNKPYRVDLYPPLIILPQDMPVGENFTIPFKASYSRQGSYCMCMHMSMYDSSACVVSYVHVALCLTIIVVELVKHKAAME